MAVALGLAGLFGGCGGSPPPTPPPPAPPPRPPVAAPAVTPQAPEVKPLPPIPYAARGRRDPFRPSPRLESQEVKLPSVKLVGIVQGRGGLLALVETPEGLGYILRTGDLIGDARVVEIGLDSITLAVTGRPGQPPVRMVLKLKTD